MTEIAFHFNAPDKMAYACRFARKALRSGIQLVITGPADMLAELDGMLWNMMPQDFVAHCRSDAVLTLGACRGCAAWAPSRDAVESGGYRASRVWKF